jgi:NAD-dependent SIR2 family protein deacetylase
MNTKLYLKINKLIEESDAIIIGAGAGLSTAAGVNYGTYKFKDNFPELYQKYGFTDMYTSSFYEFSTEEERWSYWAKHINYLCHGMKSSNTYKMLYNLVKNKNYFVITTNVDQQFLKAGFKEDKIFEVQGSLTKMQCKYACHNKLYDNTKLVKEMLTKDKDCHIPQDLVPKCPVCGKDMDINLRKNEYFVEDDYWDKHNNLYEEFIKNNKAKKILFLELGAGFNTPGIIRYPFEDLTSRLKDAYLIRINDKYAKTPVNIKDKSLSIQLDINKVIKGVSKLNERKD